MVAKKEYLRNVKEFKFENSAKTLIPSQNLWSKYLNFIQNKEDERVIWYMKLIIAFPCVVMVISIYLMAMLTPNYIWFVVLNMALFFLNIILHIAETKSKVFIPVFHLSISIICFILVSTYFLS